MRAGFPGQDAGPRSDQRWFPKNNPHSRLPGLRRAQESRVRRRMRPRIGGLEFEIRENIDVISNRSKRLKNGRKLIQVPFAFGRPAREITTHRHEDESKSLHRFGCRELGCGCRRDHGVEQRQGDRRPETPKDGAAGERLFGNDHGFWRWVKGLLCVIPKMRSARRYSGAALRTTSRRAGASKYSTPRPRA